MPHGIPDTRQFPWDQALSNNLQQLTDKVTGGINTWAMNPTVGVDGLALAANHVGYSGINITIPSIVRWNGTAWDGLIDGYKLVTTPQLDVYVNQATGNDSNDGKTASTAWKTISKFYQEINKYNLLSKQINLYLGAGTYSILFPPTTWGGTIKIIGASNASVTIQRMNVTKGTYVMIQDVTVGYPQILDATSFYWPISVNEKSSLELGQNVILGPVGNYSPGLARFHVSLNDSNLSLVAGLPVTLTGNVNTVFYLVRSTLWAGIYYNPTQGAITPNAAPNVDTGVTYSYARTPTAEDTKAILNAAGNITVGNFIYLNDGSGVNGAPNWQLGLTGTLSGAAYYLANNSYINGYVSKGPNSQGIAYPSSISSGTKDATSTIIGTGF
jgi:hypothetical protein